MATERYTLDWLKRVVADEGFTFVPPAYGITSAITAPADSDFGIRGDVWYAAAKLAIGDTEGVSKWRKQGDGSWVCTFIVGVGREFVC